MGGPINPNSFPGAEATAWIPLSGLPLSTSSSGVAGAVPSESLEEEAKHSRQEGSYPALCSFFHIFKLKAALPPTFPHWAQREILLQLAVLGPQLLHIIPILVPQYFVVNA